MCLELTLCHLLNDYDTSTCTNEIISSCEINYSTCQQVQNIFGNFM